MIKLSSFTADADSVMKIVKRFKGSELPRLNRLFQYYEGENAILNRTMESGKPNNKLVAEYCKYVTKISTGYFMGTGIKYKSSNTQYLERFNEVIDDNFEHDENFELAKLASVCGYAVELIYQNENALSRFKRLDPRESILIFSTSVESFLTGFIHLYQDIDIDGKRKEVAIVYTESEKITFESPESSEKFKETDRQSHLFGEIPAIVYKNNEELTGDFEGIISLNDGYDRAQSNTANDFDYFTDSYLIISGASDIETDGEKCDDDEVSTSDKAKTLREQKVMFFPEKGDAKFLTKEINDAATENYKERLNSDIHKFSMTPDMGDEKFAGDLSGVAIGFKTLPLEDRTAEKENKFRTGLIKRRELLTRIINIRYGTDYDYREITEEFYRKIPQNKKEETETILSLAEYISKKTLLELLPQIEDVSEELKRLEDEKADADHNDYPFEGDKAGDE